MTSPNEVKVYYKHITGQLYDFDVMSDSPTEQYILLSDHMRLMAEKQAEIDRLNEKYDFQLLVKSNDSLRQQLEEAEKVIEFYGDRQSWTMQDRGCTDGLPNDIVKDDYSDVTFTETDGDIFTQLAGGKRARQYLNKWSIK